MLDLDLNKYPITQEWVGGKTFQEIGQERNLSKQRVNVLFQKEISKIKEEESAFMDSFYGLVLDKESVSLYNYYDLSNNKNGKIIALMLKKLYGFKSIIQDHYVLKEKLSSIELRKVIRAKVKKADDYYPLPLDAKERIGFNDIVFFGVKDILIKISTKKEGVVLQKQRPLSYSFNQYVDQQSKIIYLECRKSVGRGGADKEENNIIYRFISP